MAQDLDGMHEFLTQDNRYSCRKYHYNFERQAPRLYTDGQVDSLLAAIDYIKTECGPGANVETTRMLLAAEQGQLGDSLIGVSTVVRMMRHRARQELIIDWQHRDILYGYSHPVDNTHKNFVRFQRDVASQIASSPDATPTEEVIGTFYNGDFDTALARLQSDDMSGTALQAGYAEFVLRTKQRYSSRVNVGLMLGAWNTEGNVGVLGTHPDIGVQVGTERETWRVDLCFNYRFSKTDRKYEVDSLGQLIETNEFSGWYLGTEFGYKIFDNPVFSTDLFVGAGYNVMHSITEAGESEDPVGHSTLTANIGVRHRFFLNQRSGLYIGAMARYGLVDYDNPGGTDLSGKTLTVSLMTGWSFHKTLQQFLEKLNYKGSWRF